jgi:hypothetical protein
MPDDQISEQQNLDASRQTLRELLLKIKQSLATIEDCQVLLTRVNAQIECAQNRGQTVKNPKAPGVRRFEDRT